MSEVGRVCGEWNLGQEVRWERLQEALQKAGPGLVPVSQRTLALLTVAAQHANLYSVFGHGGQDGLMGALAEATSFLDTPVELAVLALADEYDTWIQEFEVARQKDADTKAQEERNYEQ